MCLRVTSCLLLTLSASMLCAEEPVVIAHRGASGYLPEHTLPAKALAHAMNADYIEQDVVLTRDNVPIVLHDVHLDTVTNVAKVFPGRSRTDGRYYALDFTLAEIRSLRVHERIDIKTNKRVYPKRFPLDKSVFRVSTLQEEIELIQGLNRTTGKQVGIYPEIKKPKFHRESGYDISRTVIELLKKHGYRNKSDACILQCFNRKETKRLREELNSKLTIVQLLRNSDWSKPRGYLNPAEVQQRLKKIVGYADGIGPPTGQLIETVRNGKVIAGPLLGVAKDLGLVVHPYTLRADDLPSYAKDMGEWTDIFFEQLRVDGVFTDFPDIAVQARSAD